MLQAADAIYKEVIAFANYDAVTLYIGINNLGNNVGIKNADKVYAK